ncbi:MAG TPA: Ig-like domain-containing protein, partial [Abditibacteriaceae bacterium]
MKIHSVDVGTVSRLLKLAAFSTCASLGVAALPAEAAQPGTALRWLQTASKTRPAQNNAPLFSLQYGKEQPRAKLVAVADIANVLTGRSAGAVQVPPTVTAVKSDTFPVHASGKAEPGDTITYSTVITNTGNVDATGVTYEATHDANTKLVGTFKSTPIALPGSLSINEDSGEAEIILTGADPDGDELTFTLVSGASLTKGTLGTITRLTNTTAKLTYTPNSNSNGADSFGFKVTDDDSNVNTDTV